MCLVPDEYIFLPIWFSLGPWVFNTNLNYFTDWNWAVKNANFSRDRDLLAALCLALSRPDLPGTSHRLYTSPQTVVNPPVCPDMVMEVLFLDANLARCLLSSSNMELQALQSPWTLTAELGVCTLSSRCLNLDLIWLECLMGHVGLALLNPKLTWVCIWIPPLNGYETLNKWNISSRFTP